MKVPKSPKVSKVHKISKKCFKSFEPKLKGFRKRDQVIKGAKVLQKILSFS
jgi:hypothetical protein